MIAEEPDGAGDPRLRFRVWINGGIADEAWLDTSRVDAHLLADTIRERHSDLVGRANDAGSSWLIEIYNPEMPAAQAYTRFGTDTAGMVDPQPITVHAATRRFGPRSQR